MNEDRSVLTRAVTGPDETVRYGAAPDHVIDVWHAAQSPRALVVIIHGGFWRPEYDRKHTYPMAVALRADGYTVASIEYRRQPGRPDVTVGDVRSALAAVPGLPLLGTGPVIVIGHSAGGHLALCAGSDQLVPGLAGIIALAPVADLVMAERLDLDDGAVRDFLGTDAAERADLDPVRLPPSAALTVIIHGERDQIVPMALAEAYQVSHPNSQMVVLPDAGHYAVIDPESAAWPAVRADLARLI